MLVDAFTTRLSRNLHENVLGTLGFIDVSTKSGNIGHAEGSALHPHLVPLTPPESMCLESDHMVVRMSTWVDTWSTHISGNALRSKDPGEIWCFCLVE